MPSFRRKPEIQMVQIRPTFLLAVIFLGSCFRRNDGVITKLSTHPHGEKTMTSVQDIPEIKLLEYRMTLGMTTMEGRGFLLPDGHRHRRRRADVRRQPLAGKTSLAESE